MSDLVTKATSVHLSKKLNALETLSQSLRDRIHDIEWCISNDIGVRDEDHLNEMVAERTRARDKLRAVLSDIEFVKDKLISTGED